MAWRIGVYALTSPFAAQPKLPLPPKCSSSSSYDTSFSHSSNLYSATRVALSVLWRLFRIGCRRRAKTGKRCAWFGSSFQWYVALRRCPLQSQKSPTNISGFNRSRRSNGSSIGIRRARPLRILASTYLGRLGGLQWNPQVSQHCST